MEMQEKPWWRVTLPDEIDENNQPVLIVEGSEGRVDMVEWQDGGTVWVTVEGPLTPLDINEQGSLPYDPCARSGRTPNPWLRTAVIEGRAVLEISGNNVECNHEDVTVERAEGLEVDPAQVKSYRNELEAMESEFSDTLHEFRRFARFCKLADTGAVSIEDYVDTKEVSQLTVGDMMDVAKRAEEAGDLGDPGEWA